MVNINKYLSIRYNRHGASPEEGLNCWSFFRHIQKEEYGIEVAEIPIGSMGLYEIQKEFSRNAELDSWFEVKDPLEGDAVFLKLNKYPIHIGVALNKGIVHCHEGAGVVFQEWNRFGKIAIVNGSYLIHKFMRHRSKM